LHVEYSDILIVKIWLKADVTADILRSFKDSFFFCGKDVLFMCDTLYVNNKLHENLKP